MTGEAMPGVPGEPCKLISAVVPADDGTDLVILKGLREEKGILQAFSNSCLGRSIITEAKTRRGRLPEPVMIRLVEILVPESRADEVFEFVCKAARLDEPGRGAVWQTGAGFCTPFALPAGVPDEQS
jgi:hypothetical protein